METIIKKITDNEIENDKIIKTAAEIISAAVLLRFRQKRYMVWEATVLTRRRQKKYMQPREDRQIIR